ncbi:type VII secretion-associated serine protease mycosin [Actinoplanes sp. RD1]|uniref:type VII secretion-associated serine protease mycosin n=1 Tax=Actinoplanes sp. RD1 TaxID=3064538 RepID=UPI0027405F3B|nr:type VII secretion-associated serine protease mycosin [Actinoplanes sp. RD1]
MRVCRSVLAAAVVATAGVAVPAAPAHAFVCPRAPAAAADLPARPFEDLLYDPEQLARFATGTGVRVAVVDSGVDATNPQLAGHVDRGRDFLHGHPDGRQDCVGHGTAVASIIAAAARDGAGLRGLAPGATIVPVRVSERTGDDGDPAGPGAFAAAIAWAADPDGGAADVINLSLVTTRDDPRVRAAVQAALAAGVTVVAAAGNQGAAGPPSFPAAYPGVLGVGALGPDGVLADFSQRGDYVDVTAPGVGVTFAVPGRGQATGQGTSFATPFVTATAALIRQRFPGLTPAQVTRRIQATADPAPGGARSDAYGTGVLNPYRAVTETLAAPASPPPRPAPAPAPAPAAGADAPARDRALLMAAAGTGMLLLVLAATAAIRHGRRRHWRPAG